MKEFKMLIDAQKAISKAFKPLQDAMIFQKQKRTSIRFNHFSPKREESKNKTDGKPSSNTEQWYNRPIGMLGIIILGAILAALALYLIKQYMNLPSL